MINALKKLFRLDPSPDYKKLISAGGVILDVRSEDEFSNGHITKAMNIPVDRLGNNLHKLPEHTPIITCCASGIRSATAKRILMANGFTDVYDGGAWSILKLKI